jgi:hypothetical protein
MSSKGYNFASLMEQLTTNPSIQSEKLVQSVIKDLPAVYTDDILDVTRLSVFANRLKFYPLALKLFEDLITELDTLMPRIIGKLANIRGQMKNLTSNDNYLLVDAGLWIGLVTDQIDELGDRQYYLDLFREIQGKIVVDHVLGGAYLDKEDEAQKFGFSGISLYYPPDATSFLDQSVNWCATFDSAIPSPFRTHSKWSTFLRHYFKTLAKMQKPA